MSICWFPVTLVGECAIEVSLEYKVSNFLLFVALQKCARTQAASNGKIQKQRVAEHTPSLLARGGEMLLRQKCLPVLIYLGQLDQSAVELATNQGKYLDRLNESESCAVGY